MSAESLNRALQKLTKWRTVFASWQLGTRSDKDGELLAVKNHREATILLRAEVTALTGILLNKGICTEEELQNVLEAEALNLSDSYAGYFLGFTADHQGIRIQMPQVAETMQRLHFPP